MTKMHRIGALVCLSLFSLATNPAKAMASDPKPPKVIDLQTFRQQQNLRQQPPLTPSNVMDMVSAIIFEPSEERQTELLNAYLGLFVTPITDEDKVPTGSDLSRSLTALKGLQLLALNEFIGNSNLKSSAAAAIENLVEYIDARIHADPHVNLIVGIDRDELEFFVAATGTLLDSLTERQLMNWQRTFKTHRDHLAAMHAAKKLDAGSISLLNIYENFFGQVKFVLCQRKLT